MDVFELHITTTITGLPTATLVSDLVRTATTVYSPGRLLGRTHWLVMFYLFDSVNGAS
jgi:hypothetical protein